MANVSEQKQQQIASLYAHNPNVTVIVEGQMYEIPCTSSSSISLLVNLPPEFPNVAPVITVSPTGLRHAWIESDVVTHDPLTATWAAGQTSLGKMVQDIREEFELRPPTKRSDQESYGHRPPPPIPVSTSYMALPMVFTTAEYASILNKSPAELEELLNNDVAFELFFNSLERIQSMKTVQEELRNGNENLAHKNLSREESLVKLREQVNELDKEYQSLLAEYEEKEKQQQDAFNRFSASTVLTRLKASVYESDELSESVAQSFLDGNLDHDSFVKQFRELRKVYHLRASKLERAQKENLFPEYRPKTIKRISFTG